MLSIESLAIWIAELLRVGSTIAGQAELANRRWIWRLNPPNDHSLETLLESRLRESTSRVQLIVPVLVWLLESSRQTELLIFFDIIKNMIKPLHTQTRFLTLSQ